MAFLIMALIVFIFQSSNADPWKKAADISLTFAQSGYSNSWEGGESGTLAWTLSSNLLFEKTLNPDLNWRNEFKLSFGQTHAQETDSAGKRRWQSPEKSSDRLFLESVIKLTKEWGVDPFASLTFDSRFYDNSVPDVPRYINPIILTEAVGLGKSFIKNDNTEFLSRLGFALKHNIENTVVTVDPEVTETNTSTYGGFEWVTDLSHTFPGETVKYVGKARIFQAFFNSESDELEGLPGEDYWKSPDVAWENTLSMSVVELIQVAVFFELLYDKEIDLRGRFREVLGIGFAYSLN